MIPTPFRLDFSRDALLLDVDGTLLDIAPLPDLVRVPDSLTKILARLHQHLGGALALVSGRATDDLDRLFAPLLLPTVGIHGVELRVRYGAPAIRFAEQIPSAVREGIATLVDGIEGAFSEDKAFAVVLHYRQAEEHCHILKSRIESFLRTPMGKGLHSQDGKCLFEIRRDGADKGSGVRRLMQHPPFSKRRPIFIGDDNTDEDAFAILPDYAGVAASVGRRIESALHTFDMPEDVRRWLRALVAGELDA